MTSLCSTSVDQTVIVNRTKRRLEQEKVKCMQRYEIREQRVLKTLNYCQAALERLEVWAVFAIFPTDELHENINTESSYSSFVEQRFRCVTVQLRGFEEAIKRRQRILVPAPDVCNASTSRDHDVRSRSAPPPISDKSSLRMRVSCMSKEFVEQGRYIRQTVLEHLHRCRNDLHVVLQWGMTSLTTLNDVIDETMADELACMVREKMLRILADVTDFEEAADEFERTMSQGPAQRTGAAPSGQTKSNDDLHDGLSDSELHCDDECDDKTTKNRLKDSGIVVDSPGPSLRAAPTSLNYQQQTSTPTSAAADRRDTFHRATLAAAATAGGDSGAKDALTHSHTSPVVAEDSRVGSPDDWLGYYLKQTPPDSARSAGSSVDIEGHMSNRSDGSTPEPPLFARPPNLLNHPKILKDKLHQSHLSLTGSLRLSTDSEVKFVNRSWNFAAR